MAHIKDLADAVPDDTNDTLPFFDMEHVRQSSSSILWMIFRNLMLLTHTYYGILTAQYR